METPGVLLDRNDRIGSNADIERPELCQAPSDPKAQTSQPPRHNPPPPRDVIAQHAPLSCSQCEGNKELKRQLQQVEIDLAISTERVARLQREASRMNKALHELHQDREEMRSELLAMRRENDVLAGHASQQARLAQQAAQVAQQALNTIHTSLSTAQTDIDSLRLGHNDTN